MKGYNGQLIYHYFFEKTKMRPNLLVRSGLSIMMMNIQGVKGIIKFISSLNHISYPLASFPEIFGAPDMRKGVYPYIFNSKLPLTI